MTKTKYPRTAHSATTNMKLWKLSGLAIPSRTVSLRIERSSNVRSWESDEAPGMIMLYDACRSCCEIVENHVIPNAAVYVRLTMLSRR